MKYLRITFVSPISTYRVFFIFLTALFSAMTEHSMLSHLQNDNKSNSPLLAPDYNFISYLF